MVSQGFFSGSESAEKRSRRLAGQKENKVALGGDNLGSVGAITAVGAIGSLGIKGIRSAIEGGKRLKENIEKRVNPERDTSFFSPSGNEVAKVASSDLSNLRVKSPEVRIANVKSYTDSSTKPYAPDEVGKYIKESETKSYEQENKYQKVADQITGGEYNIKDDPTYYKGMRFEGNIRGLPKYMQENLKTDFTNEKGEVTNPNLGISKPVTIKNYVTDDPGIGFREGDALDVKLYKKPMMGGKFMGLGVHVNPLSGLDLTNRTGFPTYDKSFAGRAIESELGTGMYNMKDPMTKTMVDSMIFNRNKYATEQIVNEAYKRVLTPETSNLGFANYNEDGSLKTPEQKSEQITSFLNARTEMENKFAKDAGYESYDAMQKAREDFNAKIEATFNDNPYFRRNTTGEVPTNPKFSTMPSMTISKEGMKEAEKNRLEKAKQEGKLIENKNVFQKIGDTVGNVFNKLTGTEAAGAQGINTSATVNIAQMGNVSPTVQAARDAVAKANLRRSGLDKTVGGQSSQANYGSGRTGGFGTGTHGRGMPSNPAGMRQKGVGVSAGNLSRHKAGPSTSRGGISRSTSRGQGGGPSSRSRGGTGTGKSSQGSKSSARGARGSAGSRSRGGTGSGSSKSNTGSKRSSRGARKACDIRCKIDIAPLIKSNLVKDNLAEVAYFVQEIRK